MPLSNLFVVDIATVVAGPGCATYLADFGATVIKVERPESGDTARSMGWSLSDDDDSFFWKILGRGKHSIALDLKDPDDADMLRHMLRYADVLVENFRPGTLERLGFVPDELIAENPSLVITRVTGYGQTGPYKDRPGFATQAEALSGFAAINGEPEGQPLLPPIALTDEVAAIVAAFATMVAVHSNVGQVVDVSLLESMLHLMGPLVPLYGLTGELQQRLGAQIPYTVPRNTYQTATGEWVAVSSSAESVAQRVLTLIGLDDDPRLQDFRGRMAHRDVVDSTLAEWIGAHTLDEVLQAFEEAQAAVSPVYDMSDIFRDPHYAARDAITTVDDTPMANVIAQLSKTPGTVRWAGQPLDADREWVEQFVDGLLAPDERSDD